MGHDTEPKMDELKKLLRRLDGLDSGKSAIVASQDEADRRGYVGALRGAPDVSAEVPSKPPRTTSSAALWAAAAVALVSSVAAFLVVTHNGSGGKLEAKNRGAGEPASRPRDSSSVEQGLIRSADKLFESGDIEAARALLQKAAELGSGDAAFKLGRSYDPTQSKLPSFADSQSNSALARAWYERAVALGTQEAAAYIQPQGVR